MSWKKLDLASPLIQQIEMHTYVKMWNLSSVCVYFMAIATSARVTLFAYLKVLEQRRPLTVIFLLVQTAGWSSPYQWADTGMSWAGEQMGADTLGASVGRVWGDHCDHGELGRESRVVWTHTVNTQSHVSLVQDAAQLLLLPVGPRGCHWCLVQ